MIDKIIKNLPMPTNRLYEVLEEQRESQLASGFHKRLVKWINDFHRSLENEYEAGACLANFGNITFHISDISYSNPSLILFKGKTENGNPVELIQHINQLSILLVKLNRKEPEKPKRPIGFMSWEDYEKEVSEK